MYMIVMKDPNGVPNMYAHKNLDLSSKKVFEDQVAMNRAVSALWTSLRAVHELWSNAIYTYTNSNWRNDLDKKDVPAYEEYLKTIDQRLSPFFALAVPGKSNRGTINPAYSVGDLALAVNFIQNLEVAMTDEGFPWRHRYDVKFGRRYFHNHSNVERLLRVPNMVILNLENRTWVPMVEYADLRNRARKS